MCSHEWHLQAHAKLLDPANYASIESDLTWLGVAGLLDPPRPEVRKAIQDCNLAGIRVSLSSSLGFIELDLGRRASCLAQPCQHCQSSLALGRMQLE